VYDSVQIFLWRRQCNDFNLVIATGAGAAVLDYEIRLLKRDGSPTLVYLTSTPGAHDALHVLDSLRELEFDTAEIWCGADCVHRSANDI
jgi:hypothetical protein